MVMHKRFTELRGKKLIFADELKLGRIINRPNRYVAYVELEGKTVRCHVPVGGRIGGLTIDDLPCLLSGPHEGRATEYTVEALGLGHRTDPEFQWLAINQTAANSYVKEFMLAGFLTDLAPGTETGAHVRTEKKLGDSRIDFFVDAPEEKELWVEVKTPLIKLHTALPSWIPVKTDYSTDNVGARMPKQMTALMDELKLGKRVALLAAFGYENTINSSDELRLKDNLDLDDLLSTGAKLGLESWEINFAIDHEGVRFKEHKRLL